MRSALSLALWLSAAGSLVVSILAAFGIIGAPPPFALWILSSLVAALAAEDLDRSRRLRKGGK